MAFAAFLGWVLGRYVARIIVALTEYHFPGAPPMNKPANDNSPRLLSRTEAAAYCGFKPTAFSTHVLAGRLPAALPGLHKWDRAAIDAHLDKMSGLTKGNRDAPEDAFEAWEREDNARHSERGR